VRRHGGQAQVVPKRMPWVATSSTRCSIAARRSAGVSPRAFTLSANCSTSIFSWLSSASQAAKCKKKVISIKGRIGSKNGFGAVPSMVSSCCLCWSSHSNSAMLAFLETSYSSCWATSSSALKWRASSSP
jgi:hypothetical protein